MATYRDIEPLLKKIAHLKKTINSPNTDYMTGYMSAMSVTQGIIAWLPDADVVPREEVDRLRSILDSYALQYGTVKDQHEVIDRVKRETAMEIFKELETVLYSAVGKKMLDVLHIRFDDYNAIKKKYTEDSK